MSINFKSVTFVILIILFFTQNIYSIEYIRDEQPAPESVEEIADPISEYFKILPRRRRLFPNLKEKIVFISTDLLQMMWKM